MTALSVGLIVLLISSVAFSGGFVAGALWVVETRERNDGHIHSVRDQLDNEPYPRSWE